MKIALQSAWIGALYYAAARLSKGDIATGDTSAFGSTSGRLTLDEASVRG
jgi:hypothetical protein